MEHFLKIVSALLDRHAPFKSFNKKPNIYSSKPRITTGIAKSIKVKDNLYKNFSSETNLQRKQSTKNNLGHIGTIFPLSLDAQRTHVTKDFLKRTVWKTVKKSITVKQRNYLPLTTLQIGEKIETDAKELANHFSGYFTSIAGELKGYLR